MKYGFLALCVAAALCSSCSKPQAEQPANTGSVQPAMDCPQPKAGFYEILPDPNIRFDFPFHLKQDRVYVTDKGPTRRAAVFEFLDGDASSAFGNIARSLQSAGYAPAGSAGTDADGKQKQTYKKAGAPNLAVLVYDYPASVKKPAHPSAKGIIKISWKVADAKKDSSPAD